MAVGYVDKPAPSAPCMCCDGILSMFDGSTPTLAEVLAKRDVRGMQRWMRRMCKKRSARLTEALMTVAAEGNVNARSPSGFLAINEAVALKLEEASAELLANHANLQLTDVNSKTAIEVMEEANIKHNSDFAIMLVKERAREQDGQFMEDLQFLHNVKLFSTVPPADRPTLAHRFVTKTYTKGQIIIKQGDVGNQLYIIHTGKAYVKIDGQTVAVLCKGDYFGERALLRDEPRNATVEAMEDMDLKVLSRGDFEELDLRKKCWFQKRKAVMSTDEILSLDKTHTDKTSAEFEQVKKMFKSNEKLQILLQGFGEEEIDGIVKSAHRHEVSEGDVIITQGSLEADTFYMVASGRFIVHKDGNQVFEYGPGGSFGELAMVYRHPRAATVTAASNGLLWVILRKELRKVEKRNLKAKLQRHAELLDKVELLSNIINSDRESYAKERLKLADALVEMHFDAGDYIVKQGDILSKFYILVSGEAIVEKDNSDGKRRSSVEIQRLSMDAEKDIVEFIGEQALIRDEPRPASIRAMTKVVALGLLRNTFIDAAPGIAQAAEAPVEREQAQTYITYDLASLRNIGLLGCGGFGKVSLVKDTVTGKTFALKALSKGHVIRSGQQTAIANEKAILRMTDSPFLVRLAATFNGPEHIYFLLEPALGGELFTVYQRYNMYGQEAHARFYAACVLWAFEHLHQRHIIYRDLKPENLLLDSRGYCKVTDMGLAKFTLGHAFTTCGTPEYFAPEMTTGAGYRSSSDWWALGILVYECMMGQPPFSEDDPVASIAKIRKGIEFAHFPSKTNPWTDVVRKLCRYVPSERLPMRPGGILNVQQHSWFTMINFDWVAHKNRTMRVPFQPLISSNEDLVNFEASEQEAPPQIPYKDPGTRWDADFEDPYGPTWDDPFERGVSNSSNRSGVKSQTHA